MPSLLHAERRIAIVQDLTDIPDTVNVFLGGDTGVLVPCTYLDSYLPAVNDTVVVLTAGSDHLIIGAVSPTPSDRILASANTASAYTGTSVSEASVVNLTITAVGIIAGQRYWIDLSGRMVSTGGAVTGTTVVHASQGTVTTSSPVIARRQAAAVSSTTADDFSLRQLWVPAASGTWNFMPGVASGTVGTNVTFSGHTINAYLTVSLA